MDSCTRCLREGGGSGAAAAVVLLVDEVEGCPGGDAVLEKLVTDTVQAVREGRSRVHLVHAVAVDKSPSELKALGVTSITDCFTDPCGWVQQPAQPDTCAGDAEPSSSGAAADVQWRDLQLFKQLLHSGLAALTTDSCGCCLVIAGLSTLLLRHPEMEVLQVLHKLKASPHVCSMLLPIHQDLHSPQVMSALQSLSTASLQLTAVQGLQQQLISQATGYSCQGQITFSSKRAKLGRLRVDQQLYSLMPAGGVAVFAAPEGVVLDARALVQVTALGQQQQQKLQQQQAGKQQQPGVAGDGSRGAADAVQGQQLSQKLSTSMRLETSEQEREAKAAVQLPYVHQGGGKAYASGDARHYLPPAAGGYGPGVEEGAGRLGHILYVRDSDEEHDSDEDPDDDLDV